MERQRFIKQTEIPAAPEKVFAWHEQPGALEKLTPPWERVEVVENPGNLRVGARVILKVYAGPFGRLWVAEHTEYEPPHLFVDVQRSGPFAYWRHRHLFKATERRTTMMTDEIEYELPLGWLGGIIAGEFTRAKLKKMFDYRHQVVLEHFTRQAAPE